MDQFIQYIIYSVISFTILEFFWDAFLTFYILLIVGPHSGTNMIVDGIYLLMKRLQLIVDF
jgi:hypothetical protein